MTLTWQALAHSEVGLVRRDNQDSGYVSGTMVLVADGMGGAAAGDLASAVAVTEFARVDAAGGTDPLAQLEQAVGRSDEVLAAIVEEDPACDGMGTTLCGGILSGQDLTIVHIGDSRGYLYRSGRLRRLTHDHSYVQSLIDQGKLDEDGALAHPHRSLLLRVLNGQRYTAPEYFSQTLQAGDRLMFCSDGLCGLVADTIIKGLIATPDPVQAMEQLIAAAHLASGSDNITIIIADVAESAEVPSDQATAETGPSEAIEATRPLGPAKSGRGAKPAGTSRSGQATAQAPLPIGAFTDHGLIGAAADPAVTGRIPTAAWTRLSPAKLRASSDRPVKPVRRRARGQSTSRRWRGVVILIVAILVVLGGAGWGVYAYGASQFYVGANQGYVAIYQGVAGDLLGLKTSRVFETTTIPLTNLPFSYRDRVLAGIGISSGGVDQARSTVAELRDKAAQCLAQRLHNGGVTGPDGC